MIGKRGVNDVLGPSSLMIDTKKVGLLGKRISKSKETIQRKEGKGVFSGGGCAAQARTPPKQKTANKFIISPLQGGKREALESRRANTTPFTGKENGAHCEFLGCVSRKTLLGFIETYIENQTSLCITGRRVIRNLWRSSCGLGPGRNGGRAAERTRRPITC